MKTQALRNTSLFGELADAAIESLSEIATARRLKRKECVFIAGEASEGLFVLVHGSVETVRTSAEGRESTLIDLPGATLAELAVFDDGPYPSTVRAHEDSLILFLEKNAVRRLCGEFPQISMAALKLLSTRLRDASGFVTKLTPPEVARQVAEFLLGEARTRGRAVEQGNVVVPIQTDRQIAHRIGSEEDVVSIQMQSFRDQGLIALDQRRLVILLEDALLQIAVG
ncbi:MAG: Crp/Fnr family transcriptional regulator [Steroidobacteraceae bacterium]